MCDVGRNGHKVLGITGFVDELVVAIVNNRIYWPGHPRVSAAIQEVLQRLEEHFAQTGHQRLVLGVAEGYLIYDRRPLLGATLSAPKVIHPIQRLDAGGIEFDRQTTIEEIVALLGLLGQVRPSHESYQEANEALRHEGCQHIRLLPPGSYEGRYRLASGESEGEETVAPAVERPQVAVPVELYQGLIDNMQGLSVSVVKGQKFSLEDTQTQIEEIMTQLDRDPLSMLNIARYEQYDSFTFGHSVRVCFLAIHFAASMTDDRQLQNRVGVAALLHDIGKARIPFEILHAQGPLTPDMRYEMENHTTYGAEILLQLTDSDPMAVAAAFGHHRTMKGQGYPKLPYTAPMSTVTKIVKLCDVYEALTAVRPYKPAMSPVRAYRIMLSMQKHFDPGLLKRFIQINGIYPVGTEVRLSTGEIARVTEQRTDLQRPVVTTVTTPDGDIISDRDQQTIDLCDEHWHETQVVEGPMRFGIDVPATAG